MPQILLVRHGETHWNRQKRVQGHGDSPLTLKGIGQARAYGEAIARLTQGEQDWRLIVSPLPRCVQTAAILCEAAGFDFAAVAFDPRLREVSTGDYSGRLKAELPPDFMDGSGVESWFFRCPGGESHLDVRQRLSSWLDERQAGEKLVVVSHGVSGRVLRGLYAGLDDARALEGDSPQDAVFRLHGGFVERLPV